MESKDTSTALLPPGAVVPLSGSTLSQGLEQV
jgi:hypothetical protein